MSPRTARDLDAIDVLIEPGSMGRGTEEEGGGPLRGGLVLMNRFGAVISDPEVPYRITMTVGARDGWLACESVTIEAAPGGPAISGAALRSITLSLYMQRIRQELGEAGGGGLITKPAGRTETAVSYELPVVGDDWDALDFGQLRRAVNATKLTPEMAADAYREALASPDPGKNRRPTAAAADKLGASRGHISRLLTEARRKGLPGLGSSRPPRGEAERPPIVAAIVTSDRGVLAGRRNDGKPPWTFIAGEQDAVQDENPADTAVREAKEETGLRIRAGEVIGERVHPKTGRTMIYIAAAPTHGTDVFVGDEEELAEVRWLSLAEAEELLPGMYEPVREHLEREIGGTR